jgi:hypothetical protein
MDQDFLLVLQKTDLSVGNFLYKYFIDLLIVTDSKELKSGACQLLTIHAMNPLNDPELGR